MSRTAIVYRSPHHGNTKKLLDAIVNAHPDVTLIHAGENDFSPDMFDVIGFASGVYLSAFGRPVTELAERLEGLAGKDCFLLYTSGSNPEKYGRAFTRKLEGRGARVVGKFGCYGYDTYGPFKLVGGVRKGHPNGAEIEAAVGFCRELMERK